MNKSTLLKLLQEECIMFIELVILFIVLGNL